MNNEIKVYGYADNMDDHSGHRCVQLLQFNNNRKLSTVLFHPRDADKLCEAIRKASTAALNGDLDERIVVPISEVIV